AWRVLGRALEQSDHVSFRVAELSQLDSGLHLRGAHHAPAAERLRLGERRLDIGNLDVERQVSRHAFGHVADAAADPDAFEVRLALDDPVAERIAGVDRPAEQPSVKAAQLLSILAHDLEMDYGTTHDFSLPRLTWARIARLRGYGAGRLAIRQLIRPSAKALLRRPDAPRCRPLRAASGPAGAVRCRHSGDLMDLQVDLVAGLPLRRQLERQLRDAIRSGRLGAGSALPPSRVLASELGVSRGVVVDCYSQLTIEGYLSAQTGSGTRVAYAPAPHETGASVQPRSAAEAATRVRYELRPGQADFHAFPRRQWQAALTRALRELPDRDLTYPDPRGIHELRHAIAEYLRRARAVVAAADNVVVFCGLSHGLSALWHALRVQGARRVAVEDPGWRGQTRTVEDAGVEAIPVRVDGQGLVVSELARARVDAVVLTPAHQYPTGVVLSPKRRTELIEWARRHDALIVEDDYDAEYRFDRKPIAALQGLAPDVVAFAATTSK